MTIEFAIVQLVYTEMQTKRYSESRVENAAYIYIRRWEKNYL
jgi:hypothetical protein